MLQTHSITCRQPKSTWNPPLEYFKKIFRRLVLNTKRTCTAGNGRDRSSFKELASCKTLITKPRKRLLQSSTSASSIKIS